VLEFGGGKLADYLNRVSPFIEPPSRVVNGRDEGMSLQAAAEE
jgi:hypothetical protein